MLPFPDPAAPLRLRPLRLGPVPATRFEVEARPLSALSPDTEAWRGLGARALEPNVFAGPDMLLPALQHLESARGVTVALVRGGGRWLGLFPLATNRLLPFGAARLWRAPLAPLGAPLVDEEAAGEVAEALLAWLAAHERRPSLLELSGLRADGALAGAFERAARATGRRVERRAAGPGEAASRPSGAIPFVPGPVAFERGRSAHEVRDGVEHFLVLEAAAARRRGTPALLQSPGQANAIRTATRLLARGRLCRVDLARVAGEVAAAAIRVRNGSGETGPWLVAAGEALAAVPAGDLAAWLSRGAGGRGTAPGGEGWIGAATCDLRIAVRPGASPPARRAYPGWPDEAAPVKGNSPLPSQGPPR